MPHGVTLGDISMSILSLGASAFHCIQRIDSRCAIGGDGRTSAGIAVVLGGLFNPQAARDGIASADAVQPALHAGLFGGGQGMAMVLERLS